MTPRITVAIDGYSACGKSTLAKDLAQRFGLIHVDSGSMYRAVTYHLLKHQIDPSKTAEVKKILHDIDLRFLQEGSLFVLLLNGSPPGDALRSKAVDDQVSQVASYGFVREKMVEIQQNIARDRGVVMDGRDIGIVVFPNAELKIFLQADLEIRVDRRYLELGTTENQLARKIVAQNLTERDRIDSTREISPLTKAKDAVVIDNSNLSRAEQLEVVGALVQYRSQQLT
ncbi:MAG: (d)CMP kinase [Saprospiraceae bacterium]|nr:(d)CMP kinase [Saprospiraceae bacterium]